MVPFIMFAQFKGSGKEIKAYIAKSFRLRRGDKTSTVIIEKLGTLEEIARNHPGMDPREWVRMRARELTMQEKQQSAAVRIDLNPALRIKSGARHSVRGGMLPLMPLFHGWLGLESTCRNISSRHGFKYDLCSILSTLVYGRILCPDSKMSTLLKAQSFIESPDCSVEDVYRALSVLAEESENIQRDIYRATCEKGPRDTSVIYYDCTNYYFEIEKDDRDYFDESGRLSRGLRKYGHSKEGRPNPIVQMGMFMDADGMPLAFCVNPGNTPETQTIIPLERTLTEKFDMDMFVCCTDGGLGSREVREYNMTDGRDYITVQSLKDRKVDPNVQKWALQDGNWNIPGMEGEYTIKQAEELLGEKFNETTLYKDRWYKVGRNEWEEHYVVTYSNKFAQYQRQTRREQIERAIKKIERGEAARPKSPNDCRRFILTEHATKEGELAEMKSSTIDGEKVRSEERFDGLYCLATSIDDTPGVILKANHFRYEIEALFRITKTDLELRPIYLQRKDRIIGHFIVCFIALLIIKKMQKMMGGKYSVETIVEMLRGMDYTLLEAHGYIPAFDRNQTTDDIIATTKQTLDTQIITKPTMRAILRKLKKS